MHKGAIVAEVRPMTDEEMAAEGWEHSWPRPPVVVFDSGAKMYPSQDPEGNGPGAMFGVKADGTTVRVVAKKE